MPKAKKQTGVAAVASVLSSMPVHQTGMPAKDAVVGVTTVDNKFTILHTRELDQYEEGAMGPGLAAVAAAAVPTGDNFAGTARKAAKLSISTAKMEKFKDVKDLIASLTPDTKMVAHKPVITTTATSKRVAEEERNVHVTAFLYAASREDDNDFHLIVGRDPKASPEMYITMELSGLPPAGSASLTQLKAARDAFKSFFKAAGATVPGMSYDFYQPPIQIEVEGSLFFDMSHAKGSRPGPPSLKSRMPVIWEVHPISKIVLK